MDRSEITDSQDKDPEYNFHSSSQESIYSMDKLITKSTEDSVSVGKSKLSDSSINKPEETRASVPVSAAEVEEVEVKLDISSELIAEPLPDSASEVSVPSSFPASVCGWEQSGYQVSAFKGCAHRYGTCF